ETRERAHGGKTLGFRQGDLQSWKGIMDEAVTLAAGKRVLKGAQKRLMSFRDTPHIEIVFERPQPLDVERILGALSPQQQRPRAPQSVPNAELVEDVWIKRRDIHDGKIIVQDMAQHLAMERAGRGNLV